jgi:hypothetical protein
MLYLLLTMLQYSVLNPQTVTDTERLQELPLQQLMVTSDWDLYQLKTHANVQLEETVTVTVRVEKLPDQSWMMIEPLNYCHFQEHV